MSLAEQQESPRNEKLIEVEDLQLYFPIGKKGLFGGSEMFVKAVDSVSFDINRGETLGLVGESGSGKTTVGRALLRAYRPTGGEATFHTGDGPVNLITLEGKNLQKFRRHMQMIFQDPYASLNPRMTVRDIIAEPLEANNIEGLSKEQIDERVRETAALCKLNLEHLRRFPHAFSGGQRQRICIARALVGRPEFVVCDESVAALDVSIQAEIINLLQDLQKELNITFLFIAHDLSVVAHISDRVAVMYVGKIVEIGPTEEIFYRPRHPYTRALLSAVPRPDPDAEFEPERLTGEIPNPANLPQGCRFNTRCPMVTERCRMEEPDLRSFGEGHNVACHYAEQIVERFKA
ncbi:ABC transporter ATP-binding protein [Kiloniella sp. b19]|uniref:ABC transporter ATP-binding protein n=1 Tax=Kiloniella sp. GXU_MW_B19 TaxID=3141326 RepID=UPI0031E116D5